MKKTIASMVCVFEGAENKRTTEIPLRPRPETRPQSRISISQKEPGENTPKKNVLTRAAMSSGPSLEPSRPLYSSMKLRSTSGGAGP